ncbi:MAG: type II toxin-antitoxin system VapC family toxin [Microbacterium sp.]|uniref:type II toxin-antitoxin system VapC family toxin n=1 Tax=Microbacterium sp. TaxID=51671 RepID=UPI0039E483CF
MIYLDTCILIYALEDGGGLGERTRAAMRGVDDRLAASPLVLHECLVRPIRDGDNELRARFVEVYNRLVRIQMDESVFVLAAELRARHGLKAPDSLHLAAAQLARCDQLWTNDERLATASRGLAVDMIGEAVRTAPADAATRRTGAGRIHGPR